MVEKRKIIWEKWKNPFDNDPDEESPDEERRPSGRVLVGPMGIIPLNDANDPNKAFNFWVVHSNFIIDDTVREQLRAIPGVETFEPHTRYRFRMSIGKAFDEREVKMQVVAALCPKVNKQEATNSHIDRLKKNLSSKFKYWAIIVQSSGEIDVAHGDTNEPVREEVERYRGIGDAKIYTSWDTVQQVSPTE